jgi:hypothetical protein
MTGRSGHHERLDAAALLTNARRLTGLDDFGDGRFRLGLEKFLSGATEEGELNATGAAIVEATVTRFLVNRLRFEDDLKRHPEILDEPIEPPVIIMGLPRTGTTKLQRMMAVDPRFQSLRAWQIMNPAPFPEESGPDGRDPRIAAALQADAMIDAAVPELLAGHPIRAEDVDEEFVTLMEMNFDYLLLAMRLDAPRFEAWVKAQPMLPNYRYLRRCLQYLQWQTGKAGKPYLLKSPLHLGALDALLEVFPGAILVHCHRDPAAAVTSFMRLTEIARGLCYDRVDAHALGTWVLAILAEQMQKNLEQRAALGERLKIVDVAFQDIAHDPIAVIDRICAERGWSLTAQTRDAMLAWEKTHRADRYGKFTYSMEHYGKTPKDYESAFSAYLRRFAPLL